MAPDHCDQSASTARASTTRWRRWRKRILWSLLTLIVLWAIVIGPWPVGNGTYIGSKYQQQTLQNIPLQSAKPSPGQLTLGMAEVDITPPLGHPLAGFGHRKDFACVSIDSRCYARAITLSLDPAPATGMVKVTLLTADILLLNAKLTQAVLSRTGLSPEELYVTSTHTHSGPGGWGDHPLERLVVGRYDQSYFNTLADQLATCVMKSREDGRPVDLALATLAVAPNTRQINRIDRTMPSFNQLSALIFRAHTQPDEPAASKPLAVLASFSAHATIAGPEPVILSTDYPGALVDRLREKTGAQMVMFAAGAVGDVSPVRLDAPTSQEMSHRLGNALADDLHLAMQKLAFQSQVALVTFRLPVTMPPVRVPVGTHWELSPVASRWLSDRHTWLSLVRIGPAVMVGFPGDYSGHLAIPLAETAQSHGLTLIPTSFNGDYKGYFVSQSVFMNYGKYETRSMNFFGPWAGEYLNDLGRRLIAQAAD